MFTNLPRLGDQVQFRIDESVSQESFNLINAYHDQIKCAANDFLKDKHGAPVSSEHEYETYTNAPDYFKSTMSYHSDPWVIAFEAIIASICINAKYKTVVDVGCAFGITGLTLASFGLNVTFHDFPGLGLEFVQFVKDNSRLRDTITIIPYGEYITKHDVCCALDVTEHLPNTLAGIAWYKDLGNLVAISYPCRVPRRRPFENEGLDKWMDDECLQWLIQRRYQMFYSSLQQEWRSTIYG
jgi:hypothetical protein